MEKCRKALTIQGKFYKVIRLLLQRNRSRANARATLNTEISPLTGPE